MRKGRGNNRVIASLESVADHNQYAWTSGDTTQPKV